MDNKIYQIMQALQMREVDEKGIQQGYTIAGESRDLMVKELVRLLTQPAQTTA